MTPSGCTVGAIMPRWCCWRFLPIASPLWLPRLFLSLSRSSSTLLLPWAVIPPGARSDSLWLPSRRSCLGCHLRCSPASPRPCLRCRAFACQRGPLSSHAFFLVGLFAPPAIQFCCCIGLRLQLSSTRQLFTFTFTFTRAPRCVKVLWPIPA